MTSKPDCDLNTRVHCLVCAYWIKRGATMFGEGGREKLFVFLLGKGREEIMLEHLRQLRVRSSPCPLPVHRVAAPVHSRNLVRV
jgi:hypothetical protein